MTKAAAMQGFFESFGLPAFEENSVPKDTAFPYITYQYVSDLFGSPVFFTASIWYRSTSWVNANAKAEEISHKIGRGGVFLPYDGGCIWLTRGKPFSQSMGDVEKDIKRKYLNLAAEYLSAD